MKWGGRRVLITGAGGFIGSHLTERLVQLGATTRAFVHYNATGTWGWLDRSPIRNDIEVFAGDIRDRDSVSHALKNVQTVFHLAALISIPYSYKSPESFVQTNVGGTLNVLQMARSGGIERLVHTSTSEVYGTALRVPIDETHTLQGQSPYSASKIGADKMVEAFYRSFGLPAVTVRPFNTFGPRQSARAIIPTIITQLLGDQVIRLGHSSPTRDLNFVSNTVDGFVLAASTTEAIGQTINLGSQTEISISDLAQLIANLMNTPIRIERDDARLRPQGSEVERLLADNRLARQLLGWEPRVSLEEGLQRTIAWIRDHQDTYRMGAYVI